MVFRGSVKRLHNAARPGFVLSLAVLLTITQFLGLIWPSSSYGSAGPAALRVGVVNRYVLAPALAEMGFTAGGQLASADGTVVIKEFKSQAQLRQAFSRGDVDVIADSQTSLSLLEPRTAGKTRVFMIAGHSYGDIAVVTREGPSPISFFDLRGKAIGVEYGGDDHYFLAWLSDLMFGGVDGEKRLFRNGDLLPGFLGPSEDLAVVLREPWISQVLKAAREAGERYGSPGTIKVVLSTANYRPLIHYVLVAKEDLLKKKQRQIKALVDAFFAGEENSGTYESLISDLGRQFGTSAEDVYSHMKMWFADRAENRARLSGKDQVLVHALRAAEATWKHLGLIGETRSEIRFAPSIVEGQGPLGRPLAPRHRPFAFQEVELLRSEVEIHFALDSAEIPPEDFGLLDEVVRDIEQNCVDYRLEVYGYTDSTGSVAYNQKLSQRRAEAVAAYLKNRLGLAGGDVSARGMGIGGDDALNRKTVIKVFQKVVQY